MFLVGIDTNPKGETQKANEIFEAKSRSISRTYSGRQLLFLPCQLRNG